MAVASQAFTALIPLLLLASALAPANRRDLVARAIIHKFGLSGGSATAVEQLFASPGQGSVGLLSVVLLVFSGISLTRRLQRLYLQAWRLEPRAGVRGSLNAALGLSALLLEIALFYLARSLVRALPLDWALGGPITVVASLVLWTSVPWLLLDRRLPWRRLLPGGALAAAGSALYGIATSIYMPRLITSYSDRYGLFGVTLALVGWLLCISLIVIVATVVAAEFDRAPEPWAQRLRDAVTVHRARDTAGRPRGTPPDHGRPV
ncbi:MAG: YhjD/YihY/BrkB family envelope integrity protein [Blastococcus sp.]